MTPSNSYHIQRDNLLKYLKKSYKSVRKTVTFRRMSKGYKHSTGKEIQITSIFDAFLTREMHIKTRRFNFSPVKPTELRKLANTAGWGWGGPSIHGAAGVHGRD